MYEALNNPLWWVIPAILIASWVYNHRDPTAKKSKENSKKSKGDTSEQSAPNPQPSSDSEQGE